MSADEPRTHWAGVVIPDPDKATPKHDRECVEWCNHCIVCGEGILYGSLCPDHYNRPDAPVEPHAPTSGPDSTPREGREAGAADGRTEARLAEALYLLESYTAPFTQADTATRVWFQQRAQALLPLVVAYGEERAAEALRDGQEFHEREADKAETTTSRTLHLCFADAFRAQSDRRRA